MADIFSPEKRSAIMSRIKSKDSKPELIVRKLTHSMGFRYRLHGKNLPGNPDLVFPKYKKVIFVHGCFWHGHEGCKRATLPSTNVEFWKKKISGNVVRDKNNYEKIKSIGWNYLIIWQCETKKSLLEGLANKIILFLKPQET